MQRRPISAAIALSFAAAAGLRFNDNGGTATATPPNQAAEPFEQLRQEFGRLQGEAAGLVETAAKENRDLTADEKTANDKRFSRLNQIKTILDERARFATLAYAEGRTQGPREPAGRKEFAADRMVDVIGTGQKIDRAEFASALAKWAVNGQMAQKFATITTASQSGALLPKEVAAPIVPTAQNTVRQALALYGMEAVRTDTTSDLSMPVFDAAAGGAVAQNASTETENAPGLTNSFNLNVATYQSGSAWFSNQQLAAVGFDLLQYAETDLEYAKELAFESAIIAAIIADTGITQTVATATTTGFTYENLVDLNNKLAKKWAVAQVILLSQTAYSAAEKLVGDDGHPVLVQDTQNQRLFRFNGTPVLRCDYLEALTANKVVGLIIGLGSGGFKIRDAGPRQLERYSQQPGRPAQTGINLIGFHGYGYAPAAIAKLKTPVS